MIKQIQISLMAYIMFAIGSFNIQAQEVKMKGAQLWRTLADVRYEIQQDEYGDLYVPVFSEEVKKAKGQIVEVEGFIIPFEGMFKPTQLILSSLPISECFFCGSGGPETVMEISMKPDEKVKYTTKRVKIRGRLVLNAENPDKLMYLLEEGTYAGLAEDSY